MCRDCGCEQTGEVHIHVHVHVEHGQVHVSHDHVHEEPAASPTRIVEVGGSVLARNDRAAADVRSWLERRGVVAVNLISSPGAGKTLLLERTLDALRGHVACAVITGDQQTDNDARRLMGRGAPVAQIETRSACHLNAEQVRSRLESVVSGDVRLLFIENVGNLVCPAAFDLGERMKIALLSVTEGEDKPLKYPGLFCDAPVTVMTKTDLVPHLDYDLERCRQSVRAVRPDARIIEVSARTGQGMDAWLEYLRALADHAGA
jgi:hydrogenase nickel incorporation protein HypB